MTTLETTPPIVNPHSKAEGFLLWLLEFSLMLGLVTVIRIFNPQPLWDWLLVAPSIAAAWGLITTRYLLTQPGYANDRTLFRIAELVLLTLGTRLFVWGVVEGFPTLADFEGYLSDPTQAFAGLWFVYLFLVLVAWGHACRLAGLFHQLNLGEDEIKFYQMSDSEKSARGNVSPFNVVRVQIVANFQAVWVQTGFLLILASSISTFDIAQLVNGWRSIGRLPFPAEMLIALLIYFIVGFWLLSYASYLTKYANWLGEGAFPDEAVANAWRKSASRSLIVVGFVAALLPIGSTYRLGETIIFITSTVWVLAVALVNILIFIVMAPILWLFGAADTPGTNAEPLPPLNLPELPPVQEAPPADAIPPEIVGGAFWTILVIALIAAVLFILVGRGVDVVKPFKQLWKTVSKWLRGLWQEVAERVEDVNHAIQQRLGAVPPDPTKPQPIFRINALTPREQIRYFYLAAVRRARERGVERTQDKTPIEFLDSLREEWPESADASEALTDAFNEARYSKNEVEKSDATGVKKTWKVVRSSLRKNRVTKEK